MPDAKPPHPSLYQLASFDLGQLSGPDWVDVERHLAGCEHCCAQLEALPDDAFIALMRQSIGAAATPAPSSGLADTLDLRPPADTPPPAAGWTSPELPAELAVHTRYRVVGLLGRGGMGTVFKAEHRLMERLVALKVIRKDWTDRPAAVERFRLEVKAAARLAHPNIVAAHDAEQAGDVHFLVMEYVEGSSLDRLVEERGPLPVTEACDYARQAALGLQHAFQRGMVHRDIKPQNLLRTPDGQVKVLDFGLARFASESGRAGALTHQGAVVGTPDYIAPEQARDARRADIRADIYSLGCTLYHLLAGHPPFPDGTVLQKLMAQQEREPAPLSELRNDVPPELNRVLARMIAKDPARRYQTPAEAAADLVPFLEAAPAQVAKADQLWSIPDDEPVPATAAPPPRMRWPLVAVAAAMLLTAAGLAALLVLHITTPKGRLTIKTHDNDVKVIVEQGGEVVRVIDTKSDQEIELNAGSYEVALGRKGKGLKLTTDHFTLTRNGKAIVEVEREPRDRAGRPAPEKPADTGKPTPPPKGRPAEAGTGGRLPGPVVVPPIPEPRLHGVRTELRLPEPFAHVRTGGGGRYLIFHLKKLKKLFIFDLAKARVVKVVDIPAEDFLYAAGLDKLMVMLPGDKVLQRWDLHTFKREKTVPIPDELPVRIALMGCSSRGPLLLWSNKYVSLWDVERMEPIAVRGKLLLGDLSYGFNVRVSADGQAFMAWHGGISGQQYALMRLDGERVTTVQSPDAFTFNGHWAQPNADASLVFRLGAGMYTGNMQVIAADAFKDAVLLPTEDPRFFLAVRAQGNDKAEVAVCTSCDRRPVYTVADLEKMTSSILNSRWGYMEDQPRVHYLPTARLLLTLPETNDRVVVRRLDLIEALKKAGRNYLFVFSMPPTRARAGTTYVYSLDVKSKAGGVVYQLESGPEGMSLSPNGELRWKVPAGQEGTTAKVVVTVGDASGKEVIHAFQIAVQGGAEGG
ncbi:MAG TPA: serine/threonine-protein kinase [Gemmataceae bacterium]|jgi:tRNA A-37 threonylcarbamoyl transferase component Bud32|nr:serine/threonine-protein kinase [Gemmataceae bacterium]